MLTFLKWFKVSGLFSHISVIRHTAVNRTPANRKGNISDFCMTIKLIYFAQSSKPFKMFKSYLIKAKCWHLHVYGNLDGWQALQWHLFFFFFLQFCSHFYSLSCKNFDTTAKVLIIMVKCMFIYSSPERNHCIIYMQRKTDNILIHERSKQKQTVLEISSEK